MRALDFAEQVGEQSFGQGSGDCELLGLTGVDIQKVQARV
jgi:hypothetical protein